MAGQNSFIRNSLKGIGMSDIGIAMIGCGGIARAHLKGIAETSGTRLVAAMDVAQERAQKTAEEFGGRATTDLDDVLSDSAVDAVVLPLPHHLHCPVTIQAAQAGKHVMVEKPMARNLSEAQQMVNAAQEAGVQLMVGQSTRFQPEVWKAKQIISEGKLGRVRQCIFQRVFLVDRLSTPWRYSTEECGGLYLPLFGSHDVDMILWLMEAKPSSVQAVLRSWTPLTDAESDGAVLIEFEQGQVASVSFSLNAHVNQRQALFIGTEATLVMDGIKLKLNDEPIEVDRSLGAFTRQMQEFAEAVRSNRTPIASGSEVLDTMWVLDQAASAAGTEARKR